ncbi:septum formation initiator family protein [Candidatus Gottesmanbacteria bacterium]|nr:septum formation initiator family protein [Candidatus Gottesmanbacteria bacterium]
MREKLFTIGLILIIIFLSINLVRSFFAISERGNILTDVERRLLEEKERQEALERKLVQVESDEYVEREARDKLNLSRDGEVVVILPPITPIVSPTPTPVLAPLEQWMGVFWP